MKFELRLIKKPSGQERIAAERNYAAKATRRRRRIPLAGFILIFFDKILLISYWKIRKSAWLTSTLKFDSIRY